MTQPQANTIKQTSICPFCEANCGVILEIDTENQKVLSARGDKDDPFSRGFVCAKTHALTKIQDDPDVVRKPLRKKGNGFEEVSWEAAFDEIAERSKAIQKSHGYDGLATYFGNATIHHPGVMLYGGALGGSLKSKNAFATSSIDHAPKLLSSGLLFGDQAAIPVPDLDRTDFLMIVGANPVASGGSLLTAPGMPRRLKDMRARGAKVVVVDPRFTETAEIADQHIGLRPSTDAQLMLGMLNVAFAENLVRLGSVEDLVDTEQLESVRQLAAKFPPERAADITGLSAEVVRQLGLDFFRAERAACYGRVGTSLQKFGSITSWLLDVVNILSGNLDKPGGAMFPVGVVPSLILNDTYDGDHPPYAKWRSRVRNLPEIGGILPAVTLADEITTPGYGQIKGLFTVTGNPVSSIPNSERTAAAFESLDLLVSLDIYINETTRFADFILPTPTPARHAAFPLFSVPFMVRNYAKYASPALDLEPGTLHDWEILLRLGAKISDQDPADIEESLVDGLLETHMSDHPLSDQVTHEQARQTIGNDPGPDRMYDVLLRTSPHGDFFGAKPGGLNLQKLKDNPHGLDLGPMEPQLPALLKTPDKKIDLTPEVIMNDVERLDAYVPEKGLVLIGRRHVRSVNSWMNNLHFLVKGKNPCLLLMHPDDAERLQIENGERVRVKSRHLSLEALVEVTDTMRPGVLCLPHGYGQNVPGTQLSTASKLDTVSFNDISDETDFDIPSVTPALHSVAVTVEKLVAAA